MSTDKIYADKLDRIVDFEFDDKVAAVFDDMIERSVPAYRSLVALTGLLAEQYFKENTRVYDLGCSLGATSLAIAHRLQQREFKLIGVDNSAAMLSRCQENINAAGLGNKISLEEQDIRQVVFSNASVITLNLTLQFVPPEDRQQVINNIFGGLNSGGIFVMSEKICQADTASESLLTDLYYAFKRANGYSELEVNQKRSALEKVLIPETVEAHMQRFRTAGFSQTGVWFQAFNFAGFYAIK